MLIDRYAQFRICVENLSKNLHDFENSKMSSLGMRGIHALSLFQLGHHPDGMTATELAAACGVDKALISRVTAELLEAGYVAHKDPEKSRYRSKLILTASGRSCLRRVTRWICQSIRELQDEITAEELQTFFRVMLVLNDYLNGEKNSFAAITESERTVL